MKKSLMALLGIVALVAAGSFLATVAKAADPEPVYVSGTVVSVNDTILVVKTDSGEELTFDLDSATIRPAVVRVGSRIDVEYHAMNGRNHAAQIRSVGDTNPSYNNPPATNYNNPPSSTPSTTSSNYQSSSTERLPRTASPIAMIGLTGLTALSSGLGLRFWSRRRS